MCGITGFIDHSPNRGTYDMETVAARMADTLLSRGPDDSGTWVDQKADIGLAHRRLAIIDLSPNGHQPMVSADGRYVITYNGEIYNFRELRNELEAKGHQFRGTSDTEVLLEACAKWGVENAVKRCIGMFAFGLWDREDQSLTLVRDRLGIKPLYWGYADQLFLFASELKAFRPHPGFKARISGNGVTAFMRLNYIPAPLSIYEKVYKLEPGCLLQFRPGQEPKIHRYWNMRDLAVHGATTPFAMDDKEALDQLEHLLNASVEGRMIADVPLGAFFSGGTDSSIIVGLMMKQSSRPVKTFTIGFLDKDVDESAHAKKIAHYLGTDHTEFIVEPRDIFELLPNLPEWYDEPFADPSQLPTLLVSQMARQAITVALSGDGGDELFAGYDRYFNSEKLWQGYSHLPHSIRYCLSETFGVLHPLLEKLLPLMPKGTMKASSKIHKFVKLCSLNDPDAQYRQRMTYWDSSIALVSQETNHPPNILWDHTLSKDIPNLLTRLQFKDTVSYLPDVILTKVDRASMASSLEVRIPLLDHRVVEFSWSLPRSMKVRNDKRKWLLHQLLHKYVPAEIGRASCRERV